MTRRFRTLAVAVMALGLGAGLAGCGSNPGNGPADPEQEMKFREKARGLVPKGKAPERPKASEEEAKPKAAEGAGTAQQGKKKE